MSGHPPFFWMSTWQDGHFFVILAMVLIVLASATWSLTRVWYASHVSPSCQGRSQRTQASAPHVSHVQMSGWDEVAPSAGSGDRWTWPALQSRSRHQRQPGFCSSVYRRFSSVNLVPSAVVGSPAGRERTMKAYLWNAFFLAAISTSLSCITSSHCGHAIPPANTVVSSCASIQSFRQVLQMLIRC